MAPGRLFTRRPAAAPRGSSRAPPLPLAFPWLGAVLPGRLVVARRALPDLEVAAADGRAADVARHRRPVVVVAVAVARARLGLLLRRRRLLRLAAVVDDAAVHALEAAGADPF